MRTAFASLLLLLGIAATPALAERADRSKPVDIEADRMSVDDRNKVHVFEGSVVLTQGTLVIKGDKLVVTQGADGFQKGVATATGTRLATFRQKREASNEYVDGEAERIEYDSRSEQAKLFKRARVTSGGDEVRGSYIEYDAISENYLANNAPGSAPAAGSDGRVRAVIQPKGDNKSEGSR
jgi:lipopolysaccharide export system protein LptA